MLYLAVVLILVGIILLRKKRGFGNVLIGTGSVGVITWIIVNAFSVFG